MPEQTPNLRTRLEVFEILEQLDTITKAATKLPLTRRAVINPRDLQTLVARLRHVLPTEVAQAQEIIRYKDSLIGQAQTEAKRLRSTAEQESLQRVSESQVVQDARAAGTEIRARAQDEARAAVSEAEARAMERMRGADDYAIEVLDGLEGDLESLLGTTRRGLSALRPERVGEPQPT